MTGCIRNTIMWIRLATGVKVGSKRDSLLYPKKGRSKLPVLFVGLFNDKYLVGPDDPDF